MTVAPTRAWRLLPPAPPERLAALGVPPLLGQVLYNRGVRTPREAQLYLRGDVAALHDPFLLPGMEAAVARLRAALRRGEPVAVFGDFDVDGISGTALLAQALTELGGHTIPYIPHRLEGHGLSDTALESLAARGARLVVSVDTGITAVAEVSRARALGLDVVVTDHHTPGEVLPDACATVSPRVPGSTYPYAELSGAGLALKLAQARCAALGRGLPPGPTSWRAWAPWPTWPPLPGRTASSCGRGCASSPARSAPGCGSCTRRRACAPAPWTPTPWGTLSPRA